ncbi:major facilitator superfamily transporter [Phlyctema vagabunda]|uniref:Major facilitator superfamily transporter n=1 Tax=Phlyctema vagabunda TaxID=108571 RepID=A0ABR4PC21_9HELO
MSGGYLENHDNGLQRTQTSNPETAKGGPAEKDVRLKQTPTTQSNHDVPPDGGIQAWLCVGSVALINAHTWGINSSYGIFLSHYLTQNTFPGATSLEYAFVGGLSISMALLVSPMATICVRKFGTRTTLLIGVFLETAALLSASFTKRIWELFLSQGICFGLGMGFLFVASVGVVPQWFVKKRSFANSLATAGSGLGGLVYSLATNAMIQSIGLSWAFRVLAILACVVNTVCALVIKDRNKAVGAVLSGFDSKLLKRPEFLLLLAWAFFSILGYIVLLFSLPNYARSVGLTAKQASVVGAILNLGQGLGRPVVGYYSDAAGRINIACLCTFASGLFCLVIWIFAKTYGVLLFFAFIVGTVAGTLWTVIGPVGAEVVGLKVLSSALSIVWVVLVIPSTFAEPIGLKLRTPSGDYLHAQLFAGFMYLGAAIAAWLLRAWKIREMERAAADKEMRAREIQDDDAVPRSNRPPFSRIASRTTSVKSAAKGLWKLQRV